MLVDPALAPARRTPPRRASSRAGRPGRSGRGRRGPARPGAASGCRARPRPRRPPRRCRCGCRSGRARPGRRHGRRRRGCRARRSPWSPPSTIGIAPASRTWPTVRSIAAWLAAGSAGQDRGVAEVDDPERRRSRRPRPRGGGPAGSWRRGSRAGRSGPRAGRRRGRRWGRRRSPRRRRRARPGPRCRACRRSSGSPAKSGFSPNSRQRSSGSITSLAMLRPRDRPRPPTVLCSEVPALLSEHAHFDPSCASRRSPPPCAALPARAPPTAAAGALQPRGKKIFFGISDTGDSADFGGFSKLLHKHPALIESFRTWGSDFPESIERWQDARARPILHITTADNARRPRADQPRGRSPRATATST